MIFPIAIAPPLLELVLEPLDLTFPSSLSDDHVLVTSAPCISQVVGAALIKPLSLFYRPHKSFCKRTEVITRMMDAGWAVDACAPSWSRKLCSLMSIYPGYHARAPEEFKRLIPAADIENEERLGPRINPTVAR